MTYEQRGQTDYLVALKNEQTARITMRDTSLYVFIGTIFAVYAAIGQAGQNADLVELIRTCSTGLSAIMLSIYLSNDYYISKISDFVRQDAGAGNFKRWEGFHRDGWRHHVQKFFRTTVVILLFGGWSAYQALPVIQDGGQIAQWCAFGFGLLVLFQLLMFLTVSFELRPNSNTPIPKSSAPAEPAATDKPVSIERANGAPLATEPQKADETDNTSKTEKTSEEAKTLPTG